jgi:O-antigen/teichoic acid export membrane protein
MGTFYASIGHVQLSYKIALFSAILSIMMNIIFIPRYGIIGAAMATSLSLIVLTIVNFSIVQHFINKF